MGDHQRYVMNGEISTLSDTKVDITELPIRTWTTNYKEMLETMMTGNEKTPAVISEYKDYNTDKTVKFVVSMTADKLRQAECDNGLHQFFKLQTTMSTTSMVLFDHLGCLKKYETVEDILEEFFELRLKYYGKRKKYQEGMLSAEASRLSNQARFILEKCDGTVKVENKKRKIMISELTRRGYDSDPVKAWKKAQLSAQEALDESLEEDNDEEKSDEDEDNSGPDYDYLVGMPMWNLTEEKKAEYLRKRDEKQAELRRLQATTKEEMWETDLEEFLAKLDEVEDLEKAEAEAGLSGKNTKKQKGGRKGGATLKQEALPSPMGIRVVPRIADDLKVKAAKAVAAKERKGHKADRKAMKAVMDEKDEFDLMTEDGETNKSLSMKLGTTPDKILKGNKVKQTKLNFNKKPKAKKGEKKRNPWSDGSEDDQSDAGSDLSDDAPIIPREKPGRAAAAKATYNFDADSDSGSSSDLEPKMFDNSGIAEDDNKPKKVTPKKKKPAADSESDFKADSDSDADSDPPPAKKAAVAAALKPKPKKAATNGTNGHHSDKDEFDVSDSGSDFGGGFAKKFAAKEVKKPAPKKKEPSADDLFNSFIGSSSPPPEKSKPMSKYDFADSDSEFEEKPKPKAKPALKKKKADDSDDDFGEKVKPKKKPAPKKPKKVANSDDDDDDMVVEKPKPKKKAAPKKKKMSDSDNSDFDKPAPKKAKKPAAKKKSYDDSGSGSDLDFDMKNVEPARDRPGRARATVNYGAADESEGGSDSDF